MTTANVPGILDSASGRWEAAQRQGLSWEEKKRILDNAMRDLQRAEEAVREALAPLRVNEHMKQRESDQLFYADDVHEPCQAWAKEHGLGRVYERVSQCYYSGARAEEGSKPYYRQMSFEVRMVKGTSPMQVLKGIRFVLPLLRPMRSDVGRGQPVKVFSVMEPTLSEHGGVTLSTTAD